MKVSLNIIKQLIDFELPPVNELVDKINRQLGGVEELIDLADKYKDVLIVKVIECEKHPDADRLSITKIDDGGVSDAPRDENGLIQVVCGAPNVHTGMFAAWLPPKSTVPSSYGTDEPFVLEARKLRGVLSQGMMAASDELDFDKNHETIVEINADEYRPSGVKVEPGASFAKAFGLDDTVIDIENKMFTHRPDLFGQIGVAREIAGILGHEFHDPDWYWTRATFGMAEGLKLEVFNDALDKSPRFMSVALKDITVAPSPLWLQCAVVAMGSKPISNVVDITNYLMLMTAQPVHAYDYDQLAGHKLGVRMAKKGEKTELLNGKTYELDESDIVIVDGNGVVGLAGIMGGGPSEVTPETKNVVLEVATFDMYALRKTSMKHGLFTDALTRFNKGQSPLQNERVIAQLMTLLGELTGAKQASAVFDLYDDALQPAIDRQSLHETQLITSDFINQRLGLELGSSEIQKLLHNVKFACYDKDGGISFTAPFWRTDIELPEDIVEEVGRLYGYDKLPRELPQRSIRPVALNPLRVIKNKLRDNMARFGANEVLTYSFVHRNVIDRSTQNVEKAFRLSNALSPDLQYYRLSVMPSLLAKVNANLRAGNDEFALFEIGKAHHKDEYSEDLPRESSRIASVYVAKTPHDGAAYFRAKYFATELLRKSAGLENLTYQAAHEVDQNSELGQMIAPFDKERTALIYSGTTLLGVVGEFKGEVSRAFKLSDYVAGFEILLDPIEKLAGDTARNYQPLSRFPSVAQDLSLRLTTDVNYNELTAQVEAAANEKAVDGNLRIEVSPKSIYAPKDNANSRTITYHIEVTSDERTLREDEASEIIGFIVSRANQKYQAVQS